MPVHYDLIGLVRGKHADLYLEFENVPAYSYMTWYSAHYVCYFEKCLDVFEAQGMCWYLYHQELTGRVLNAGELYVQNLLIARLPFWAVGKLPRAAEESRSMPRVYSKYEAFCVMPFLARFPQKNVGWTLCPFKCDGEFWQPCQCNFVLKFWKKTKHLFWHFQCMILLEK